MDVEVEEVEIYGERERSLKREPEVEGDCYLKRKARARAPLTVFGQTPEVQVQTFWSLRRWGIMESFK
jgi:hypothetical protein